MQMLDFKDIFVFFCKLNNFGSVLGHHFMSNAK